MRCKNNGQVIIEYVMLATIIFLGIIIGGPALVRSVQGYFKITDESVQDSDTERFVQDQVRWNGKECKCSTGTPALSSNYTADILTWARGECGVGPCAATQRYYSRSCTPMKCGQEEGCVTETNCCSTPMPLGCGIAFAPGDAGYNTEASTPLCTGRNSIHSNFPANEFIGTCRPDSGTISCAVGERLYEVACGNTAVPGGNGKITHYACKKRDNGDTERACLPSCWEYPFPRSRPCSGIESYAYANPSTLDENDNNMYLDNLALENDDTISLPQRRQLTKEVIFRLSTKNTANAPHYNITTRRLTKNVETSDKLKFDAYRNHFVYLKRTPTQCKPELFCERTCPGGYGPNLEDNPPGLYANETCVFNACWYGWWNIASHPSANHTRNPADSVCNSTDQPKICQNDTDICGYLAICSYPGGATYRSSDTHAIVYELTAPADSCNVGEKKIIDPAHNNKTFCYKVTPDNNNYYCAALPQTFSCTNFGGATLPTNAANTKTLFFVVVGCPN